MADKVYLHRFGEGKLFGGRIFSVAEGKQKAQAYVKKNKGEIVQVRDVSTDAIIKTFNSM